MEYVTRDRVPALTVLLSVVSLGLVFGAAGGAIPQHVVPAPPRWVLDAIPLVNAVLSLAAIATIATGWWHVRRRNVSRHRRAMLVAVVLFATFLVLYLYRLVAMGGASTFDGPDAVYRFVYLPILVVHMGLAVVCIPLLYYVVLLASSHSTAALRETPHARLGRVVAPLWLASFALGVVVYLLLYHLF